MPGLQYIAVKAKFPATALRSFRSGEAQWRVRVLKVCLSDTTVVLLCISLQSAALFAAGGRKAEMGQKASSHCLQLRPVGAIRIVCKKAVPSQAASCNTLCLHRALCLDRKGEFHAFDEIRASTI